MKISIITPTSNSARTILRNVSSVASQTYNRYEQIIIDNKSSDATLDIIKRFCQENNLTDKVFIFSEQDRGISDAFNKGIEKASGDIITILNSDDEYFSGDVLNYVVNAFNNADTLLVHGDVLFIDPVYGSNRRKPLPSAIPGTMYFNHPTLFVKKELYRAAGLYSENFKISMDLELYCRIAKVYGNTGKISRYLDGHPLVKMYAGGASWANEAKGIKEVKKAYKLHGFWNSEAKKEYYLRLTRTGIKKMLSALNLNFIIKKWRDNKWER